MERRSYTARAEGDERMGGGEARRERKDFIYHSNQY